MKRKIKKSTWLCTLLFLYVTATAIWLAPENREISLGEKLTTLSVAYAAIALLWLLLRRKEKK